MKYSLTILILIMFMNCNAQHTKAKKFMAAHNNCGGGGCGNLSYKIWKDSLTCYIVTSKAIPYTIKELSEGESLHLFEFIENDKANRILTVKLKNESDSRALQGFICDVISDL